MGNEKEDYFRIRLVNRNYVMQCLRDLFKGFDFTDNEFDETEKEENLNIHSNQSEIIKRKILLKKICYPILSELSERDKKAKRFFDYSWGRKYLEQAENSFKYGLLPATIILCRCALETGIREAISRINEVSKGTSFLQEYSALEDTKFSDLIKKASASEINLLKKKELEEVFAMFLPFMRNYRYLCEFDIEKGHVLRKLLDKFVHDSYSDLFSIVKEAKIDGKKYKDWKDFIEKLVQGRNDLTRFEKDLYRRWHYASIIPSVGLALYFLQVTFEMFKRMYFERLPNLN
jgi:hypothetical protein